MTQPEIIAAVIASIVGSIITICGGLFSYLSTRANIKSTDRRDNIDEIRALREEKFVGVEAAERIGNISLSLAQSLQAQLADCTSKKDQLEQDYDQIREQDIDIRLQVKRAVRETRELLQDHEDLHGDLANPCPGFDIVQQALQKILADLEVVIQ